MRGLAAAEPALGLVRRVTTRAPDLGGEDYDAVTLTEFLDRRRAAAFCLSWEAHGLHYGIPAEVSQAAEGGSDMLVNLSRAVLSDAANVFPSLVVLSLSASPEKLAQRLAARNRETPAAIARRLQRIGPRLPSGLPIITVKNEGALDQTVQAAIAQLYPERA